MGFHRSVKFLSFSFILLILLYFSSNLGLAQEGTKDTLPPELLLEGQGEPGLLPEGDTQNSNSDGDRNLGNEAENDSSPGSFSEDESDNGESQEKSNLEDRNLMGEENACRAFDIECQCINPDRDIVLPSRAFGREELEQEPCLSPEEIDNLVKAQGGFRCLREIEGAPEATCNPQWTCRVPCQLATEREF